MALQSGLTPFREDTPEPERARQTVPLQDPNFRAPGLAPVAAPVSTFNRALSAPQDDNANRLAAALSDINPSLQRFASSMAEEGKDDVSSSVQAKILKVGGDPKKVEELMASDPEMQAGLGKAAASRRLGQLLAAQAVNEAKTKYQTDFDRVNGDLGALTAETMKPYIDKYGEDPVFRKQFVDDVTPGIASLRNSDAQTKAQDAYTRTQDDQSKIFLGIVSKAQDAGKDPKATAADVVKEFYGNEKILRMPYADQQKALVPVVRALAEQGKYDVVQALAETERNGEKLLDNPTVGPSIAQAVTHARSQRDKLTKDATVADRQDDYARFQNGEATPEDEQRILALARKKDGSIDEGTANAWVQTNRNQREAAQAAAKKEAERVQLMDRLNSQEAQLSSMGVEAVRGGKVFSLPQVTVLNKKGEEETLGGDKFRERAFSDFEEWSTQYAQQKGESWDQTVLREAPIYAQNGYAPKKWKDTLAQGGASIAASALSGEAPPEAAQRGYAMYKLLHANNARLLNDLVPKDQRDFYEAWRVGEQDVGLTAEKALLHAAEANADPNNRLKRLSSVTTREIKDKVAQLGGGFRSLFGGPSSPDNIGEMGATVQRLAENYAVLGLGAEKAVERAVQRVRDTHVQVNGSWIDASDRRIPPGFPELAGDVLASYAAKHGKAEGLEASDLTVRSMGGGGNAWKIVRRSDGVPVDDQRDGVFVLTDLLKARALRDDAADEKTLGRMRKNATTPPLPRLEERDPNTP
ncbi:hypothetical protein [Methylobacterium sp. Leaf113]|uniref:hypothetical protein n=1 Tax=Methylobacterium sp. Leaf113 TaxID=1736259 RepID=UPI0012E86A96|nr:hypothetical protein [Methylobacterium sp. Leaf113]